LDTSQLRAHLRVPKVLVMNGARSCIVAVLALATLALAGCSSSPNVPPPVVPHRGDTMAEEYVVGGHVRGLEGIGLSLRNARGDELHVDDDGKFVFGNRQQNWSEYEITIAREPISPAQTCTIEHAEGRINGRNVMNVDVVCKTVAFEDRDVAENAVASR
jgi:hypothetical protein